MVVSSKKKCTRCEVMLSIKLFQLKRNGQRTKMCDNCREVNRARMERRKCEHDKQKNQCKQCKEIPTKHKLCDGHIQKLCKYDCNWCHFRSFARHMMAKYWDYEKNNLAPRDIFIQSNKKFWFKCDKCPHGFNMTPNHISAGRWCPYCAIPSRVLCHDNKCKACYKRSFASHPKAKYWDYNMNKVSPRDVLKCTNVKYWFKCPDCLHNIHIALNKVCDDKWCCYCVNLKLCDDKLCKTCHSKSMADHEKAKYWNYDKNKVIPRNVFKGSSTKYWFDCPDCPHCFDISPNSICNGNRCRYCVNQSLCHDKCEVCSAKSFANHYRAKYWDTEKNKLTPRDVFRSSPKKYWFKCDQSHSFEISLNHISTRDQWCQYCKHKTERKLHDYLTNTGYNPEYQAKFSWCKNIRCLPFDFRINNVIIELDGPQHFKQVGNWGRLEDIQNRDRYKEQCAVEHGYIVIRLIQEEVWYNKGKWANKLNKAMEFAKNRKPCILTILAEQNKIVESYTDSIIRFWHDV